MTDPSRTERTESSRALAPVTDFDWNGRESLTGSGHHSKEDRDAQRTKSPFASVRDGDERSARPTAFFDLLTVRTREKPSPELLERRATFEQLLNPGSSLAAKTPGSLDPVASLDPLRPGAAPGGSVPGLSGPGLATTADPMQAMNQQRDRLRGPVLEDVNKKYSAQPGSTLPGGLDGRYQTPLSRQPAVQQFPTRKF